MQEIIFINFACMVKYFIVTLQGYYTFIAHIFKQKYLIMAKTKHAKLKSKVYYMHGHGNTISDFDKVKAHYEKQLGIKMSNSNVIRKLVSEKAASL